MILGILSDTHGQAVRAGRAVALLRRLGATSFVHCGDVGSEGVFDHLAGLRAWFVWGNTDDPTAYSDRFLASLGLEPPGEQPLRIELCGRKLAVFHGHEPAFSRIVVALQAGGLRRVPATVAAADGADYILYGHTHVAAERRVGPVRLINPGALHRARPYTVATLDLETDTLEHWRVDDDADEADFPRRSKLV